MRTSRIFFRFAVVAGVLALLLLAFLLILPGPVSKPPPPLPFDASGYVATTSYEIFPTHLPPHPSLRDRFNVAWYRLLLKFGSDEHNPTNWTFAASPAMPSVIQGMLNQCAQASGVRYLMPPELAPGVVRLGNSNALDGRRWIASVEAALQTNTPGWWDARTKKWRQENLVLIRYPKQKTVLVLPAATALEFRRTNSSGVMDQIHR